MAHLQKHLEISIILDDQEHGAIMGSGRHATDSWQDTVKALAQSQDRCILQSRQQLPLGLKDAPHEGPDAPWSQAEVHWVLPMLGNRKATGTVKAGASWG
jgi:hypothetical protein